MNTSETNRFPKVDACEPGAKPDVVSDFSSDDEAPELIFLEKNHYQNTFKAMARARQMCHGRRVNVHTLTQFIQSSAKHCVGCDEGRCCLHRMAYFADKRNPKDGKQKEDKQNPKKRKQKQDKQKQD